MADQTIGMNPVVKSRHFGLGRAVEALWEGIGRLGRARGRDAGVSRDVVEVGSVVRVFDVDALREATLVLAPNGWSGTTQGIVGADSPAGAALLGGRVGQVRRWDAPSGPRRLEVVGIVGRMPGATWAESTERRHAPAVGATPSRGPAVRRPNAAPLPAPA